MQEPIQEDFFNTLSAPAYGEYKEKGSKFLAYAFPVSSVDGIKGPLLELKKKHYDARHWCFAYRINPENPEIRANDDGEPSNSAGMPIFNQLQSFEVWNVFVVVVRYFGGTKLGVSGLVNAYKTAAAVALSEASIVKQYITLPIRIQFPYELMNDVARLIKQEELIIEKEEMGIQGGYSLQVRKHEFARISNLLRSYHKLQIL